MTEEEDDPRNPKQQKTKVSVDIGYRRPPRQHQFKPGQSGNPRGRPKGLKTEATIMRELLSRKIKFSEKGREQSVTMREALLRRALQDGLRGNLAAMRYLDARYAAVAAAEPQQEGELSGDEKEVLNEYAKRLLASLKEGNDEPQ